MVLHTEGVVVEMVERMVDTIRHYYKDVEIAVDDIDLDAGTLTVRRSYGEGTTKSAARADTIPLHRDLVALLRALYEANPDPKALQAYDPLDRRGAALPEPARGISASRSRATSTLTGRSWPRR